jgi:hypothetical protein
MRSVVRNEESAEFFIDSVTHKTGCNIMQLSGCHHLVIGRSFCSAEPRNRITDTDFDIYCMVKTRRETGISAVFPSEPLVISEAQYTLQWGSGEMKKRPRHIR